MELYSSFVRDTAGVHMSIQSCIVIHACNLSDLCSWDGWTGVQF